MAAPSTGARVRLAEIVAMISLGTDLGMGQSMEHVMRQSVIALRLAERLGLDEATRAVVYYAGLLGWVGCHVDAYEQAKWFGDDQALKADYRRTDMAGAAARAFAVKHVGAGRGLAERARLGVRFAAEGRHVAGEMIETHWVATNELAEALGLGDEVRDAVYQTFERWDGKGVPAEAAGEQIRMPARLVTLADVLEIYHRDGGVEAAVAVARERSGTQFDPGLVEAFCADAAAVFEDIDSATTWHAVIEAEPGLEIVLADAELESALEAIADFTDLKSPWTIGHSRGVADLAHAAAPRFGLSPADATLVRRAGLVHDLGRLGVSNAIWDKPGALTPPGRLLAAADAYRAMTEPRPHRAAMSPEQAAAELRAGVRAARFDGDAADAVLHAAGHASRRRRDWPAGLTNREVEVLRLLVRGHSNKEIAEQLVISRKTAGSHVEHIYAKIGVSNRAQASLFAMKHGLMTAG